MNQKIQQKIDQYKLAATGRNTAVRQVNRDADGPDSLGAVIRSQKDADTFMAELESIAKRAK